MNKTSILFLVLLASVSVVSFDSAQCPVGDSSSSSKIEFVKKSNYNPNQTISLLKFTNVGENRVGVYKVDVDNTANGAGLGYSLVRFVTHKDNQESETHEAEADFG